MACTRVWNEFENAVWAARIMGMYLMLGAIHSEDFDSKSEHLAL